MAFSFGNIAKELTEVKKEETEKEEDITFELNMGETEKEEGITFVYEVSPWVTAFEQVLADLNMGETEKEEDITYGDEVLMENTADAVKVVVTALEGQKVVHYLKLEGYTLGDDAAAAIGKALEKHPEFRRALWKNMFIRRLKTEIAQALKHLGSGLMVAKAQLTELDLSDNALGPNGMVGLEDLLRSPVCYSLQVLRLNNCDLGIGGGQMLSKALLDCHRTSTAAGTPLKLKVFITGHNRLENDGAKAIAKIFATIKTLEEIDMPQNSIYHDGIAALAEGFKQNPNLKILNLNDNKVTSKGAQHLAEAFASTLNLRVINFGDCLLETNGACHFAEALKENHHYLEVVDLSFNDIGPNGGLVLAKAMQNKPLVKLILDGNLFGYEDRMLIKEAMNLSANPHSVDDEEDYGENAAEETAYMTSQGFTTKMLNQNESFASSNKRVTFADKTTTVTPSSATASSKSVTFGDKTNTATKRTATAKTFCLSRKLCTLEMFDSLPETDKLQAFKNVIERFTGEKYFELLICTTMKCAHLAHNSSAALELATSLFKECVDYAVKTKQEERVLRIILRALDLVRSDSDPKWKFNVYSGRYALRETLVKQTLASDHMKGIFKLYLDVLGLHKSTFD